MTGRSVSRPVIVRVVAAVAAATAVLGLALAVRPTDRSLAVHVYLLVLAALGVLAALAALRAAGRTAPPSRFDAPRTRPRAPARLAQLVQIERTVALASSNTFDLHYRLRPLTREIAGDLLAARRGIELDSDPDRARDVLGRAAFDVVRADRSPPRDRFAHGPSAATLRQIVEGLERI